MKNFLDEHFLLETRTAQILYHDFASQMPVIDYHCHLPPASIADDTQFENLTQVWLNGDHYKWRAMRTNGIAEDYITGKKSDKEKFLKWAETVPYTLRNPLYHWTHLELQRYFDVNKILNKDTASSIYEECSAKMPLPEYSVKNLLRKMKVEVICTTDDPVDTLEHHKKIKADGFEIKVLPAFRPDAAMEVSNAELFCKYLKKMEAASGLEINSYQNYLDALKVLHHFFNENGCTLSDHGLEEIYAENYTDKEIESIFNKVRSSKDLELMEVRKFKSAVLFYLAELDAEKGWVQQFHLGALRNNNGRMYQSLGADTGWDSIGDFSHAKSLAKFLNTLDQNNKLAKTILYNLNPADNEVMATMIGNFNDGSSAGKIQWGSAWWFLDQKDGMIKQINALSNMGLLSKFVGMLTDSRSFLSYPRHEYFRRILCNLFGSEIENGELPADLNWTGKIIEDICYHNAKQYFSF
ncbi:MAG: glucuronate isomerase [Bacteroidetes bacterium]|nr:glucuronate isomerase [Bacteroidota bacterium]MBS1758006.1 glucuronate isomerase [Bacteroidota bacterium]